MQTDSGDMSRVVEHLAQVEGVAEDILADKQKLIDLDRRRNKTREAMRILQKDKTEEKKWICFGNMFIKVEKKKASRLLEHDDIQGHKRLKFMFFNFLCECVLYL
nr:hypothetical protein BaRGS_027689 [Batillaria attramentaria]